MSRCLPWPLDRRDSLVAVWRDAEKPNLSLDRFQIKMEKPISDTVDDDEFEDLIEDNDCLGR